MKQERKPAQNSPRLSSSSNGSPVKAGFMTLAFMLGIIAVLAGGALSVPAQPSGGGDAPNKTESGNKADQNLRSAARVNPSTLAMEFSLPLMTYTGRNGNSLPVSFSYSSKVWEMRTNHTWWYYTGLGQR
ncbi:MAG: hypothetical protein M3384_00860, partial [Acidobacteriota bacterium]|nr:hypothetical protein [Acidobacteriota bacterium]